MAQSIDVITKRKLPKNFLRLGLCPLRTRAITLLMKVMSIFLASRRRPIFILNDELSRASQMLFVLVAVQ